MRRRRERTDPPSLSALGLSDVLAPLTAVPGPLGVTRPSQALRPELQIVRALWRENELLLHGWLPPEPGPMLRVLHGPAGAGKTRAVLEAASSLVYHECVIGGLRPGAETTSLRPLLKVVQAGLGVLVVVDDAPGRPGLEVFLDRVARLGSGRIRVLLVSRHPAWARLFVERCSHAVQQELPGPRDIEHWHADNAHGLVGNLQTHTHWNAAHQAFSHRPEIDRVMPPGQLIQLPAAEIHAQAYLTAFTPDPAEPTAPPVEVGSIAPPVEAEQSALPMGAEPIRADRAAKVGSEQNSLIPFEQIAARGGAESTALTPAKHIALLPAKNTALALAELERANWPNPPPGLSARQVRMAVAVLCLLGAEDEIDALGIVASVHGPADIHPARLMALVQYVQALYPGSRPGSVSAPQPALLAHALIVPVLASEPSLRRKLFGELENRRLAHVVAVLTAADVFPEQRALLTQLLRERRLSYDQLLVVLGAAGDRALGTVLARTRLDGPQIERLALALGSHAVEAQIALSQYRLNLRQKKNTLNARLILAEWLTEAGRRREAIAALQLLLKPGYPQDRRLAKVFALRARLDLQAEQYQEAVQWAGEALRQIPKRRRLLGDDAFADALAVKGQALVLLQEQDAGLAALQEAVAQFRRRRSGQIGDQVRHRAWLWLAEELDRRGRTEEARSAHYSAEWSGEALRRAI